MSFEGEIFTFIMKLSLIPDCSNYDHLNLTNSYKDCLNITQFAMQIKVDGVNETHKGDYKFTKDQKRFLATSVVKTVKKTYQDAIDKFFIA